MSRPEASLVHALEGPIKHGWQVRNGIRNPFSREGTNAGMMRPWTWITRAKLHSVVIDPPSARAMLRTAHDKSGTSSKTSIHDSNTLSRSKTYSVRHSRP